MSTLFRRSIVLTLFTCLFLAGSGIQPVRARTSAVFDVNSTADLNDDTLNSVCSIGSSHGGPCTLRGVIAEANASPPQWTSRSTFPPAPMT